MFQLLCKRYEHRSTIITSNKAFAEWGQIFGDDVIAAAMLDRFLHHCHVLNLKGESYRMKSRNRGTTPANGKPAPRVGRLNATKLGPPYRGADTVNLLAFGAPGSGKSHLLSATGHALIDVGRRVLFTRCSDLVQRLQAARRDLRLPQELAKLDRFDLLSLDDLGYVSTRSSRNVGAL
jgi:DNA replication protein DnaC